MRKRALNRFFIALLYGAILLAISSIRDNNAQPSLWLNVEDFIKLSIIDDPKTFARAGLELSIQGWLTQQSAWIFNLWPPGFVLLLGAIFKLFGADFPFLVALLVCTLFACIIMLMTIREYLLFYIPEPFSFLLPLAPFLFPVTRFFLLQPVGLSFGEGFSVIFFIIFTFLLLIAVKDRSVIGAVFGGIFLALAAYFRSQYELIALFLCFGALGFLIVRLAWSFDLKKKRFQAIDFGPLKMIAISMLMAQVLMFPWRLFHYVDSERWGWVQTQEIVIRNSMLSEHALLEMGAKFVVAGGGHLTCKFESSYCEKTDPHLFYKAFFNNFASWINFKISLAKIYWFSSVESFPKLPTLESPRDYFQNWFFVAASLSSLIFLLMIRRSAEFVVHIWVLSSFCACFFVIFALVQFEVRYFFLPKIFSMFVVLALASAAWSVKRKGGAGETAFMPAGTAGLTKGVDK